MFHFLFFIVDIALSQILLWCGSFVFFKGFDEITQVIKTRVKGYFGNGLAGSKQIIAGTLNSVVI